MTNTINIESTVSLLRQIRRTSYTNYRHFSKIMKTKGRNNLTIWLSYKGFADTEYEKWLVCNEILEHIHLERELQNNQK